LSQFPNKEHLGRVQWNYKFFNSQRHEKSVRTKTAQFYENRSELLQKFFEELQSSFKVAQNGPSSSSGWPQAQPPVKLVYSALAASVQDFTWDAPEIMSPIRHFSPQSRKKVNKRRKGGVIGHATQNVIFVCSTCPQSEEEVGQFLYGSHKGSGVSMEILRSELLPPAVLLQLEGKGIAVHWVDMHQSLGQDSRGPFLMSNALKAACGTLIPMSTLVSPACNELIQQATHSPPGIETQESESQSRLEEVNSSAEERVTQLKSHTSPQVASCADADDRMDVCAPEVYPEGHTSAQSILYSISNSSPTLHNDRNKPIGSLPASSQSFASQPNRKKLKSSLPSHKLLPSLVFPPSTHLRQCLQVRTGQTQSESPALQDNLFWLCTVAGKILCILDLNPMHTFCEPLSTTCQKTESSWRRKTTSVSHSLQTHPTEGKEKEKLVKVSKAASHKTKKKLSVSIPDSQSLNARGTVSQTMPSCQLANNQHSPTDEIHCNSGGSSTGVGEPILKEGGHTPTVPHTVALGVINQSDLPLTWLHSATVYSCVGLYVPREFRSKNLNLGSSNLTTAKPESEVGSRLDSSTGLGKHKPSNKLNKVEESNESPTECTESRLTEENPKTPKVADTSSIFNPSHSTSPSQQVMRVSPQIHLCRYPITPPSRNTFKKMSEKSTLGTSPKMNKVMSSPSYQELRRSPRLDVLKIKGGSQVSQQDGPSGNDQQTEGRSLIRISELSTTHSPMATAVTVHQCGTSAVVSPTSRTRSYPNSGDGSRSQQSLAGGDSCVVSIPLSLIDSFKKASTGREDSSSTLSPQKCLPGESLTLSGRFHSRWFQHLCLWLSRNGLLLVSTFEV